MSKEEFIDKIMKAYSKVGSVEFPDFYKQFMNYAHRLQSADTQLAETSDRVQFNALVNRTDFRQVFDYFIIV